MNASRPDIYEYTLPAYWASYLINGDDSGMLPEDKTACAEFLSRNGLSRSRFMDCGEPFFSSRCDAPGQMAGERCLFTYLTR